MFFERKNRREKMLFCVREGEYPQLLKRKRKQKKRKKEEARRKEKKRAYIINEPVKKR